jgi:hypothetical protein
MKNAVFWYVALAKTRIGELGTTLAVTGNRSMRRNTYIEIHSIMYLFIELVACLHP